MKKKNIVFLFIIFFFMICSSHGEKNKKYKIIVTVPEYHMSEFSQPLNQLTEVEKSSRKVPDPAGETEIIKVLISKYNVLDIATLSIQEYEDYIEKLRSNFMREKEVFEVFNKADFLIFGEAFSTGNGNVMGGLKAARGRVEVKMVNLKTGNILFTDGEMSSGVDISEFMAGKKALEKSGNKIGLKIDEVLSDLK